MLGLKHKGQLGPGADGDVTIYTPNADKRAMFELPRYVIKAGEIVVEKGEIRQDLYGQTLHVSPAYDEGLVPDIKKTADVASVTPATVSKNGDAAVFTVISKSSPSSDQTEDLVRTLRDDVIPKATKGQGEFQSKHHYTLEEFGLSKEWIQEELGSLLDHYSLPR